MAAASDSSCTLDVPELNDTNRGEVRTLGVLNALIGQIKDVEVKDMHLTKIEAYQKIADAREREDKLREYKKRMNGEYQEMILLKERIKSGGAAASGRRGAIGKTGLARKVEKYILDKSLDEVVESSSSSVIIVAVAAVISFLTIGTLVFCYTEELTFVNGLYFVIVTITTVGYGDICPQKSSSKWFCNFFVIFGVGLIGGALGIVGNWILDKKEEAETQMAMSLGLDEEEDDETDEDGYLNKGFIKSPAIRTFLWAMVTVFFFVFFGVVVYMEADNLTFANAFYMSCITVTTVGYGDISPQTESGRVIACFWLLFSVVATARAMGSVVDVFLEWRLKYRQEKMLKKQVSMTQLMEHAGDDGKLDFEEFVLLKLQVIGMIDGGNLQECADTFRALDTDKSGSIDRRDLEELERQQLHDISRSLGHSAIDVTTAGGAPAQATN